MSVIPKQWADKPWPILTSPQGQGLDTKSHYSVYLATDMCHVHNIFIRAMNSIYLQSPYVTEPADIADLLFYTKTVIITIDAHHDSEEKYLFPGLAECTKQPMIMATNQAQHKAFHDGLEKLGEYCANTSSENYSHNTFQSLIDSFATPLFQHLNEEIATILALKEYPERDLKALWMLTEKHLDKVGTFDEMLALAFGCIDRGYEGGVHKFPPATMLVTFIVKYWFARKHQGAWRFNPCDKWGTPRSLHFLPQEEVKREK